MHLKHHVSQLIGRMTAERVKAISVVLVKPTGEDFDCIDAD